MMLLEGCQQSEAGTPTLVPCLAMTSFGVESGCTGILCVL